MRSKCCILYGEKPPHFGNLYGLSKMLKLSIDNKKKSLSNLVTKQNLFGDKCHK